MRISVVIPTHNEALAIERVLADLSLAELPPNFVTEVIVVDSNSTDGTPDIAVRMGSRVIQEPRRGYGRFLANQRRLAEFKFRAERLRVALWLCSNF